MNNFFNGYINSLKNLLDQIDVSILEEIISTLERTSEKKSKVYVVGNGGSSATASHMANDLGIGLRRRDIRNINIVSLGDNSAVTSAIANDIGFENIFYMQLKGILQPDDVIIAISCSGNSSNITKAIEYAKEVGAKVIGVTGFDGGKLKELSDVNFHVDAPKGEYGLVEDVHMILDHMIYSYYIEKGKCNVR
ncbi:SIS domain-containing protein [Arcobacter sp. FWKO B]|uniref:SIS domain-containing protein n=1 Tax=Arcobacter sp. FWKO B TaxID=2593672 RepID=UPI0018A4C396|nr:SIS domain-containing protein [Arcobacter sp. FWKO B]QOG12093.1 SIS domain-containing protein [Arcobacter sp. FWKO B]